MHFVVVFNLTRFARDKYDHFALRSHLQSLGISLRSATEPTNVTLASSKNGLPEEAQRAIRAIVGKPVMFVGYDDGGRAELYFADPFDVQTEESSHTHKIWVEPAFIERYRT